jgi:hypothetical protein
MFFHLINPILPIIPNFYHSIGQTLVQNYFSITPKVLWHLIASAEIGSDRIRGAERNTISQKVVFRYSPVAKRADSQLRGPPEICNAYYPSRNICVYR